MPGKVIIFVLYLSITKSQIGKEGRLTAVPLLNYMPVPSRMIGRPARPYNFRMYSLPLCEIAHYIQTLLVLNIYTCIYIYNESFVFSCFLLF